MADTIASPSPPITDRRVPPRGALPRRQLALWGVGLVAMVIVLFALTAPSEKPRAAAGRPVAESSAQLDAKPLIATGQNYREQERQARERAASQPAAFPTPLQEPARYGGAGVGAGGNGTTSRQPDPIAEDRAKREYESLFTSSVVANRRRGSEPPRGVGTGTGPQEGSSLQDIADAVVKASQRGTPTGQTGPGMTPTRQVGGGAEPAHRIERTPPISTNGPLHTLLEGSLIDCVLTNRLDGSSASPVNAMVTNPVYSHNGDHVLIPAGARVLGDTKPVTTFGESRLAVSFHRLIFPDGSTVSLDQFKGLGQAGDSGIHDQVNNHYLSTFGAAAAIGFVQGLGQYVGNASIGGSGSGNRTVVVAGSVGNSSTNATSQVMSRFLNRMPTITIREGTRMHAYITQDIDLMAYEPAAR